MNNENVINLVKGNTCFKGNGSCIDLLVLNFKLNSFKSELLSKFHHKNVTFTSFENNFENVLNQQVPPKIKSFSRQSKATFK